MNSENSNPLLLCHNPKFQLAVNIDNWGLGLGIRYGNWAWGLGLGIGNWVLGLGIRVRV